MIWVGICMHGTLESKLLIGTLANSISFLVLFKATEVNQSELSWDGFRKEEHYLHFVTAPLDQEKEGKIRCAIFEQIETLKCWCRYPFDIL